MVTSDFVHNAVDQVKILASIHTSVSPRALFDLETSR